PPRASLNPRSGETGGFRLARGGDGGASSPTESGLRLAAGRASAVDDRLLVFGDRLSAARARGHALAAEGGARRLRTDGPVRPVRSLRRRRTGPPRPQAAGADGG